MNTITMSVAQVAGRLGLTTRRVRGLIEIGVLRPLSDGRLNPDEAVRRYGIFKTQDRETVAGIADAVEADLKAAMRGLERLRASDVPDPFDLDRVGRAVDAADGNMKLLHAMKSPAERALLESVRETIIGGLATELCEHLSDALAHARRHSFKEANVAP